MKGKINGKKIKAIILIAVFILSTITLAIPIAFAPVPGPVGSSRWKSFTPVIDGTIEDAWLDVASTFELFEEDGTTPSGDLVYVMNDEEYLYVAFDIQDPASDYSDWAWAGVQVYLPGESEMNTVGFGASGPESTGEWIVEPVDGSGQRGGTPINQYVGESAITAAGLSYELDVIQDTTPYDPAVAEMKVSLADLGVSPGDTVKLLLSLQARFVGYYRYPNLDDDESSSDTNEYMDFTLASPEYIEPDFEARAPMTAEWILDPEPAEIDDHGRVASIFVDKTAGASDAVWLHVSPVDSGVTLDTIVDNIPTFLYYLPTGQSLTTNYLHLELTFTSPEGATDTGSAEITLWPIGTSYEWSTTVDTWLLAADLDGSVDTGGSWAVDEKGVALVTWAPPPTPSFNTFVTAIITAEPLAADWVLSEVAVVMGWTGMAHDQTAYIDYITIGDITYDLEPTPVLNKEWYHTGDTATVSLSNNLENRDPTMVDLVPVLVASMSDSGKTIVLTETGPDTDSFTGSFGLVATTPGTGELLVRADDDFWVFDYAIGGIYDVGTIDDTYPTVDTLRPVEDDITTDNHTTISAYVQDDHLKSAYMTVDGVFRGIPRVDSGTLEYTPDTLDPLSEGSHYIVVRAEDLAGNVNSTDWYFTVDTMKPTATISMNVTGDVKAGDVEFYAEFSEGMVNATNILFVHNVTDTIIDFDDIHQTHWTANATYTMEATIGGDYNGTAQVNVTGATDLAGKTMTEASYNFYIDTVDPTAPGQLNATALADSVVLEWLASADFGGVDEYKVYRGTATGVWGTLVDSVDHPIVTFTDTTLLESGIYFYVVKAYDEAGNFAISNEANATFITAQVISYNVTLAEDWNLFSLPLIPDNASIEAVLADVMANVAIVYSYQDDGWLSYIPAVPSISTLTTMEDGKGYWIQMTTNDTLEVNGYELPDPPTLPPVYPVYEEWNLIGYKEVSPMLINDYIATIPELVRASAVCYGWDATLQIYELVYLAGSGVPETRQFIPGQGYWLYLTEDANIAPPVP